MRIGIFTNTYWPSVNGVAVSVANLREGLEKLGHEPYVFAPKTPGFDHGADPENVIRFPSFAPPQKKDYPIAIPSLKVLRKLRKLELDVVHVQHPWWVGKWGLWWGRYRQAKCIMTVHTQYGLYAGYSPLPENATLEIMEKMLIRSAAMADLVTTPGAGSCTRLQSLGITTPVIQVSNPTKLSDFIGASGEGVRAKHGIRPDEILLGYVGRLNGEKNLEVLIKAFKIIAGVRPDVKLMIVGDGSERERLERLVWRQRIAPGRIIFAGAIDHSEIAPYFAAMDLFVTPSKSEVQPMSFAEAFATGTPIVAFDVTGCNDMVKPGVSGILVPFDDGERGLANGVLRLLAEPSQLHQLARSAAEWARQYDQIPATEAMLKAYEFAGTL